MKRIVQFVEGEGEAVAIPRLIKRILTDQNAWGMGDIVLDEEPYRVGHLNKLLKNQYREWKRKLQASLQRRNVGGVLLVLDGDLERIGTTTFCAAEAARALADQAKNVGGGIAFSVAVVFARQEYESWLIAGIASLAGKRLGDGRLIAPDASAPDGDLEESPRDAKRWLSKLIEGGYKPTRDQAPLTQMVDLRVIRDRNLRSFQRLESAVSQLVLAIRNDKHFTSPI